MTSLCKTYWQVFLAQGLAGGIGLGILFLPALAVVPHWFQRRRALATGIIISGSSVGGIAFPSKTAPATGAPATLTVLASHAQQPVPKDRVRRRRPRLGLRHPRLPRRRQPARQAADPRPQEAPGAHAVPRAGHEGDRHAQGVPPHDRRRLPHHVGHLSVPPPRVRAQRADRRPQSSRCSTSRSSRRARASPRASRSTRSRSSTPRPSSGARSRTCSRTASACST
jgi:hypothetical protein